MDIQRSKSTPNWQKPKLLLVCGLAVVVALVYWLMFSSNSSYAISEDSLLVATVERGEFAVNVRGVGVLAPKDVRWIATAVDGKVERIMVKAGALVKQGDLIVQLSNPQLIQQMEEHEWELDELEAQAQALKVSLESTVLDQEARVINEKLNYEKSLLTLNAQQTLLQQGVNAVSAIDHAAIKIEVAQNKQRWELEIKRLQKQKENANAQLLANQARLNRMRKTLERAQQQVDNLMVVASIDAIVQEMPMELGQQVNQGDNLARLAKRDEFIAELRIPENLVQDVQIGQQVLLDTRTSKVNGKVLRIDPSVINNVVQVDVELTEPAPKESRPELTIEGVIEIVRIPNTLFVKRPMFAKSNDQASIYVMDENNSYANQNEVKFGRASSNFIEVKEGLRQGQTIIVSDVSSWQRHSQVKIN